jgi:hypothetical protein
MKTCRKCKTVNGSTTRFCSRCGTRLPAGFPSFELNLPVTNAETPLKAREYIVHPLQKKEDLILPENIGKKISPRLNSDDTRKHPEVSTVPKLSKPEQKIPSLRTGNTKPAADHIAALKKPHAQIAIKTYSSATEKRAEKNNSENSSENNPKKLLLTPADRMLLKKQLNPGGFRGLKPEDNPFAMLKAEEIAVKKQQNIKEQERKKRINEDMAYLEQLFVRKDNSTTSRESIPPENNKLENTQALRKPAQTAEKDSIKKPERIAIPKKTNETPLTQGLRHMKDNRGGEQVELLSPFLTLAAFLYFCYVLYI